MILPRIIPCLLLSGKGLVKGVQFKNHTYIGDPINAVQIFNTKEADEIIFLDITATKEGRTTSVETIEAIASQCLMPFAIGGGIRSLDQAKLLLKSGAEKVCLSTAAVETPELITQIANTFGNQSIIVSIDYKKNFWGINKVYIHSGTVSTKLNPVEWAIQVEKLGAGEILINSIDNDGSLNGYDLEMVNLISSAVNVPVIALGGAGSHTHFQQAITNTRCAAVAAGSMFVFHGKLKGVLISYPSRQELISIRGE